MLIMFLSLLSLFISAFLAATLLPLSSEVLLLALLRDGGNALLLVTVASIGNTLGSVVNWWLGHFLLRFKDRPWFYFTPAQIDRAQHWYQRYGKWSLLFAWMPFLGDGLTLIGGVMRVRLWLFVLLVGFGKTTRYIVVASLGGWFFGGG